MDYICFMAKIKNIDTLTVDSTVLCCNFINTVSSWKVKGSHDYLDSYGSFLKWCRKLEVSPPDFLDRLQATARGRDQQTAQALENIKEIRKLLQELIVAIIDRDPARRDQLLPRVNILLREAAARERLEYGEGHFSLGLHKDPGDLLSPLWNVIHSLKGLLTENDLARIKECPKCGWVFLDRTKNGRRIWCSPQACGSSDKMKRYNQRKRESRT